MAASHHLALTCLLLLLHGQSWSEPEYSGGGIMWGVNGTTWHRDIGVYEATQPWTVAGMLVTSLPFVTPHAPITLTLLLVAADGSSFATLKLVLYLQDHWHDGCALVLQEVAPFPLLATCISTPSPRCSLPGTLLSVVVYRAVTWCLAQQWQGHRQWAAK